MGKKIYKYIGPEILDLAFSDEGSVNFKCEYPMNYNDPYELFLTINIPDNPELLAYYNEVVGNIPQFPTTCFSNSPIVTPMWAHYAHNLTGFVIEIDEEKLKSSINDLKIEDIEYRDTTNDSIIESLRYAYGTGKPRHTYLFENKVFFTAYFSKNKCWEYELERRVVATDHLVKKDGDLMRLYVPQDCVTAILSGSRTNQEKKQQCQELCKKISCDYYEMKIGKCSSTPFFINTAGESFIFDNGILREVEHTCLDCGEPIEENFESKCQWCDIGDEQKVDAAMRNPFRVLEEAGMLDGYIEAMNKI